MTQTLPESNYRYATHSEEQTSRVTPPEGRYPMGDATIYSMLNKKTIVHLSVFFLCISFMFFRKVLKPLLPQSTAKMGDDDAVCPVTSNKP